MANLFSNISFNQTSIDLNLLIRAQTGFYPYDNDNYTYNGVVYEDILELDYYSSGYRAGIWGGAGITYKSDYSAVTGGTVTGYLEYYWDGATYIPGYGIEGMSAKATDFYKAALSTTTSDDLKLIEKILAGNDNFSLSNDDDVVFSYAGNDNILANAGDDLVRGGKGNDYINGGLGSDELYGDEGNDTLVGGLGVDHLSGGAGNDTYYADDSDILLDSAGTDTVITSAAYFVMTDSSKIENLICDGSDYLLIDGNGLNNTITGNDGRNDLYGFGGADIINGGLGIDMLSGGAGKDVLTGGEGNDWFYFGTASNVAANIDRITDFSSSEILILDQGIYTQFAGSQVSADNLVFGKKALDTNDYLIYNNGTLSYDADGSGAGKAVAFVTLVGAPTIDYLNFSIF